MGKGRERKDRKKGKVAREVGNGREKIGGE